MKGLTREELHQWHGQPGHWTCKRCHARMDGGGPTDGICSASLSGRLDFAAEGRSGGAAARPTRLDTPGKGRQVARQGALGEAFSEREIVDQESQSQEVCGD